MNTSQLITLGVAGGSGASLLSGSLLSEAGTRVPVKLENPYLGYDLACTTNKIFNGLDSPEQVLRRVTDDYATSKVNLPNPSSTENVQACYRITFHQTTAWAIGAARIELTASRGNYGIILLNVIGNVKDYGGRTSVLRAIFLEKSDKWQIKGGLQWSDEAFLRSAEKTQKIQLEDSNKNNKLKEIVWFRSFDLDEFPEKNKDPIMFNWKDDDNQSQNIYQELTVKPKPPVAPNTQDFWNGNREPIDTKSSIYKPSAVLEGGLWKKTSRNCCNDLGKVKDWFNLFTDKKGSWS